MQGSRFVASFVAVVVTLALTMASAGAAGASPPVDTSGASAETPSPQVAAPGQLSQFPMCIAQGPDGNAWVREGGGTIADVAPDLTVTEYPGYADTENTNGGAMPHCIAVGPDGNVWYEARRSPVELVKVSPNGTVLGHYPIPDSVFAHSAWVGAVATGPDGKIWFTAGDAAAFYLGIATTDGGVTWPVTYSGTANPIEARDIVTIGDHAWISGPAQAVNALSASLVVERTVSTFPFTGPPMAAGPDGSLWTESGPVDGLVVVQPNGTVIRQPFAPWDPTSLPPYPFFMTIGADGNAWWANGNQLGEFDTDGDWVYYEFSTGLDGITTVANGDVWFIDQTNRTVDYFAIGQWVHFMERLWLDALGRPIDDGAKAYYGFLWTDGEIEDTTQMSGFIVNTDEYLLARVDRLYQALLRRHADPGGQSYWAGLLRSGWRAETLESALIGSNEYWAVQGGSNIDAYITAVYHDLLGRAPDPGGAAYWHNVLAAGTNRQAVANGLVFSREALLKVVTDLYQHYLQRGTDPGGLNYWTDQLQAGMTDEHLVILLTGSDEYFDLAQQD